MQCSPVKIIKRVIDHLGDFLKKCVTSAFKIVLELPLRADEKPKTKSGRDKGNTHCQPEAQLFGKGAMPKVKKVIGHNGVKGKKPADRLLSCVVAGETPLMHTA
jgi:hypothetical protein